jgi:hypothetical protein
MQAGLLGQTIYSFYYLIRCLAGVVIQEVPEVRGVRRSKFGTKTPKEELSSSLKVALQAKRFETSSSSSDTLSSGGAGLWGEF